MNATINPSKPPGGPKPCRGGWLGSDFVDDESWIRVFTLYEIIEIEGAMRIVQRKGITVEEINREQFLLPSLEKAFSGIQEEIEGGRGFVVLRGLPLRRYTLEEARLIYWGIGTHIGRAVSQNVEGDLIGDIRVVQTALDDPHKRGSDLPPSMCPYTVDACTS